MGTDRHTDTQTDADELLTPTTVIGMSKNQLIAYFAFANDHQLIKHKYMPVKINHQ